MIKIICVGKIKETYFKDALKEYYGFEDADLK